MRRKLSLFAAKMIVGSTIFTPSIHALTLNGKEVTFANSSKIAKKSGRALAVDVYKTIIVQFDTPLDSDAKNSLYDVGVDTIVYAGDNSYYLYGKSSFLTEIDFSLYGATGMSDFSNAYKTKETQEGGLTTLSESTYSHYKVLFLKEMSEDELENFLLAYGIDATIHKVIPELRQAELEIASDDIEIFKSIPLVQYLDKNHTLTPVKEKGEVVKDSRNLVTAKKSDVTILWTSYALNGENMDVGIVDGGVVRSTHQEFNADGVSRVINKSDSSINFHATHVAGTIAAEGDNESAKGMASKATLYSYGFNDVAFAESILALYQNDGVLISNHSYGYSDKIRLGEYDTDAATQDIAVSNNPYLNVFQAAGNDGEDAEYDDYGIIKGPANAKNIFTIGALNINASGLLELSSTGPALDGRIKPDLCVRGDYIESSSSDTDKSYAYMSGTSMATPAATGMATLVMQQYKRTTGGFDMRHDVLKAVLINTAIDKENVGPDYKAGFGMINAKDAVDVVKTITTDAPLLNAAEVSHGKQVVYDFVLPNSTDFKTTLSWVDLSANPSSSSALVNDLDLLLVNKDNGRVYYPYTLDKNNPSALAVQSKANHVDTTEQIEVHNIPSGNYQLKVTGFNVVSDTQEYAIAANIAIFDESSVETLKESQLRSFVKTIHNEIL